VLTSELINEMPQNTGSDAKRVWKCAAILKTLLFTSTENASHTSDHVGCEDRKVFQSKVKYYFQ